MRNRILIIDDEPDVLLLVRYHLEAAGYEVLTSETGLDGLNQARREQPDLILLDLVMGDMDGFTVCEILHCQHSTARIPVIMVTAMASELTRINGLAAGAADYLCKPYQREDLLARVTKALQRESQTVDADEDATWMAQPLAHLKLGTVGNS